MISFLVPEAPAQSPVFKKHLKPKPIYSEKPAILQASVQANPEASFQWFKNDQPLEPGKDLKVNSENNRSVLVLKQAEEGEFTVRAENVYGSVTSTAYFQLVEGVDEVAPEFAVPLPSVVNLMDGDEVTLQCQLKGIPGPTPEVSWLHNGIEIVEKVKEIQILQTEEGLCQLRIAEVFPEDSGEYVCRVGNSVGEDLTKANVSVEAYEYVPDSEIATSTVHTVESDEDVLDEEEIEDDDAEEGAPKFLVKMEPVTSVQDGQLTVLRVTFSSVKPRGVVKWFIKGQELVKSTKEFRIEKKERGVSQLVISEIFPEDEGGLLRFILGFWGDVRFLIKRVILQGSTAVRFKTNTGWMCPRQSWLFTGLLKRVTWIRVNNTGIVHTHTSFKTLLIWVVFGCYATLLLIVVFKHTLNACFCFERFF